MYGLRSHSLVTLPSSAKKAVLSLDYDWKGQKVFWVSLEMAAIMWSSLDQKMTGSLIKGSYNSNVAGAFRGMSVYGTPVETRCHLFPQVFRLIL